MSFLFLAMLIIGGILLLSAITWGGFLLLVQLGVIVKESQKPVYMDTGDYKLSQGRDVGRDEKPGPQG